MVSPSGRGQGGRPPVASIARRVRRMCVLAAVVAAVAGCVGMPSNGPAQEFSAGPQGSAPGGNLIVPLLSGPQPEEDPSHIVQGFLIASASYPTNSVADEYLVSSAVKGWNPDYGLTVFSTLNVPNPAPAAKTGHGAAQQATVDVTGTVRARFNGSGQYISAAQSPGQAAYEYPFQLVKVNGQWRIKDPPNYRMLTANAFPFFYKPQDLYFFAYPQDQVLVPDSVFVPLGATPSQLLDNLVSALAAGPKTPWLEGATDTEFPPGASVHDVAVVGSTATVDLRGHVAKDNSKLGLFAAQLVWTLAGSPASPPNTQVVLELNGQPWTPHSPPCPGGRNPGLYQTQAAYACYNPYPSSPTSFYYVDRGQTWGRCGSVSLWLRGLIGPVQPVVGRTGTFTSPGCGQGVKEGYAIPPPVQPPSLPAVSMATVSPDGKYLAVVSAAKGDLYVGRLSGQSASFPGSPRLAGGGVTALSWDRSDNLWVAQHGDIVMLPPGGKGEVPVMLAGALSVSDLSVAPDGVRIAFIAQGAGGQGPEIYLAAIGGGAQNTGQLGPVGTRMSIRNYAFLGPNITDPTSLAWYDADDLIVLNHAATVNALWEAPVDGQQAQKQVTPPGVTSITSGGAANVLVAGLSGNSLAASTSLEGPWIQLGESGQNPAYSG